MKFYKRGLIRYSLATAAVLLILLLHAVLTSYIGPNTLYISTYPVIMIVALTLGFWPGLFTTVVSVALTDLGHWWTGRPLDFLTTVAFHDFILLLTALYVGFIGDRLRAARAQATEARTAETALRKSEIRYRHLFESMQDQIVVCQVERDDDGQIVECSVRDGNTAFLRAIGASSVEEVRGKTYSDIYGPEGAASYLDMVREAMDTGKICTQKTHFAQTGRYFITTIVPLEKDTYLGTGYDITERKRAEEELEILSRFPSENPNPVLRIASDYMVLYCNNAGRPLLRAWQCQVGDKAPEEIQEQIKRTLSSGTVPEMEFFVGERVLELVFAPVLPSGYVNIYGRDITEPKRIERAIRKSEQQLRQAMRLNRSFTFEWNVVTDQVLRAEECAEVMGLPMDTATRDTGKDFFQKILPEDREQFISILKGLTPDNDTYATVYRLLRPDGELVILEETARGVFNEDGGLESLMGITADVTARKKAEAAVRRHNAILEGINGILNAALTCKTEDDLGFACLEIVEKATQSKVGFISEVNEDGLQDIAISVSSLKACAMTDATGHRKRPGRLKIQGIFGTIIQDGKSLFTNDPAHHPDGIRLPDGHPPLLSFLGVPLIREGRAIGMIAVGNREGGYSIHQQEFLEALAPVLVEAFLRKRAEDALRQSREDLGHAQRVGQIGNWRLDVAQNTLVWSEENYRIFDIPQGTPLTYETFLECVYPDDRQFVDDQWKRSLTGAPYDIEHRIVVGRETKWVRERAYLEFDDTDNLKGGFGITQDITHRKRAEAALRSSRDRFALMAETAGTLLQSNEPQQLVETLCRRVMEHLDCQVFFNFLADEETGRLHLNAYAGIPEKDAASVEWLDYGVAVCGCVAADGSRIVAEHIPAKHDPRTELVRAFGVGAYACHPLAGPDNNVIGTLSFGTRNRETFDEDDLALMKNVADHVAIAMQRVNSERALRRAYDELEHRVEERTNELRRTSLYARSLIEASLDPLVTISPQGKIMDVNRATEMATGIDRDKLIGSDFSDYFMEPEKAWEGYQRVMTEGQVTDYPLTIRHTSGTTADVLYNAVVYRNEAGEIQGIFAAARDVTRSKKAEQALRQSEARLSEAQRIAHLGGWDWDIVADELDWSDEMYRIFGFVPQSLAVNYGTFLNSVHPGDRQYVDDCVKQALTEKKRYDLEFRIVLPDQQERVLHAQGEVLRDAAARPVRMVGTVLDITEQVKAREEAKAQQQQLIQADKMVSLGILVSGIAHEINNPNHSIMSNITALSGVWESVRPILDKFYNEFGDFVLGGFEYSESRNKLPEMFANALTSSRRIDSIVTELRDFSRYSPKEKMTDMDINSVLRSAVILLSNMIEKTTDRLVIEYGAQLPPVVGNFQRIEQVLINLIQNACRALPSRDKGIFLSTRYSPALHAVQIEVRDEGMGIPEEDRKRLGDPFFTTSRAAGGMGLGLWVSFNIVHEHGGKLEFHSNMGEGTRAILILPIHRNLRFAQMTQQTREEGI